LVQLAQWQERFAALGVNVAAMTYDDISALKTFHDQQNLDYPLLRDVDAKYVKAFGVLNQEYQPGDRGYGIPYPGILFIRPDGEIAAKFAVPGYRGRPPFEDVYQTLEDLGSTPAE
jgi:peroxiredoxin